MKKIEIFLRKLLEKKVSLTSWLAVFLSAIFVRSFIEQFLALSNPLTPTETIMEFVHNLYFFGLSILISWIILSLILRVKPQKLSYLLVFSVFSILAPSIIDMLKTHGQIFWSFYILSSPSDLWRQYVTIFGHLPSGIVYFGSKITSILAAILAAGLVWFLTKKIWKTALSAIAIYTVAFFMGAFPSFFYYAYIFFTRTEKISSVHSFEIAGFFGSSEKIFGVTFPSFQYVLACKLNYIYFILLMLFLSLFFYLNSREKFWAVLKNLRWPQIIYHGGIFFIGVALGILQYQNNFNLNLFSFAAILILLICIGLSWIASVVINDINDFKIDQISNAERPLPKKIFTAEEYFQFGVVCFFLAVLGGVTIGLPFAILLVVYQILAWLYSAAPFRFKKFPIVATFISSLASLMILFLGFILLSDDQTIHTLSWRIIFLLLITYTLSLPVKDFKDIAGDKKEGIWTMPVILGEKKARLVVAASVFISFILSVFFLNEIRLFPWAIIFGTANFVIINNNEIEPRKLSGWVLGVTTVYLFVLVWVAFL